MKLGLRGRLFGVALGVVVVAAALANVELRPAFEAHVMGNLEREVSGRAQLVAALAEDGAALLAPPERAAIARLVYALADIIETGGDAPDGGTTALKTATDALNAASAQFAARRLDASVRRAFSGQRVDLLEGVLGV